MAKVTGPLYSVEASGTVGKSFTFGNWKGIQWVRSWFKPSNPNTQAQQDVRNRVNKAVASYHTEDSTVIDFWNSEAEGTKMSGFNLYVKRYVEFMRDNSETEPTTTDSNPMA